jgi:hypothetical protein
MVVAYWVDKEVPIPQSRRIRLLRTGVGDNRLESAELSGMKGHDHLMPDLNQPQIILLAVLGTFARLQYGAHIGASRSGVGDRLCILVLLGY